MRYSDIKKGHIYFVDLEPVRQYEFGGNHLGIVLKKGQDNRSVTVVSLTSKSSGVGENKIDIGVVPSLPTRLVQDKRGDSLNSYVVLDQVRTVVANRVQPVLDGKDANGNDISIECPVSSPIFNKITCALANSTISILANADEIWTYHKDSFIDYSIKKMINLAYVIIKGQEKLNEKSQLKFFYNAVKAIKSDFSIEPYLNKNDLENKVLETLLGIVSVDDKVSV